MHTRYWHRYWGLPAIKSHHPQPLLYRTLHYRSTVFRGRNHNQQGNMERQPPLTVKRKIKELGGVGLYGSLECAAMDLYKFPDAQAKARYEIERLKNWVIISNADTYDHAECLNNIEHRVEYQTINDILTRLWHLSNDSKRTNIYRPQSVLDKCLVLLSNKRNSVTVKARITVRSAMLTFRKQQEVGKYIHDRTNKNE